MNDFLQQLLAERGIEITKTVNNTTEKLTQHAKVNELKNHIATLKNQIMDIFDMYNEKEQFKEKHLVITNANAKKEYNFTFDLSEFPNISIHEIKGLDDYDLVFNPEQNSISGTPKLANSIDITLVFSQKNDENQSKDTKIIPFIINADPKDMWLDKPSDRNALYFKEESEVYSGDFLDKKIVIASKRGRSHAHDGTFRDDDFKTKNLADGWAVVALSDGAGSAKFAREGSRLACDFVVESLSNTDLLNGLSKAVLGYYSTENTAIEASAPTLEITNPDADIVINPSTESINLGITSPDAEVVNTPSADTRYLEDKAPEVANDLVTPTPINHKSNIINALYKDVVLKLHNHLIAFAQEKEMSLKDLNATLIFSLVKKFDFGYVVLSFGVGDCPINIMSKDLNTVQLINWLDVGEFGGGTRFITMPELFGRPDMTSRFTINKYDDFSKLFLMTDGIYDPKFVTENKLEDLSTWTNFLKDLNGENEDNAKVDFDDHSNVATQLLSWMDFWSKGNHDDRTLAIIY